MNAPTITEQLVMASVVVVVSYNNTPLEGDMLMIKIPASQWVQDRIQDLILNNVTKDWSLYNK